MKHKKLIEYILNQYKTDALPLDETVEMLEELFSDNTNLWSFTDPTPYPPSTPTSIPGIKINEPYDWPKPAMPWTQPAITYFASTTGV